MSIKIINSFIFRFFSVLYFTSILLTPSDILAADNQKKEDINNIKAQNLISSDISGSINNSKGASNPKQSIPSQFGGVPYETSPTMRVSPNAQDVNLTRKIDLTVGKSIIIDLPRSAGEVFIGDPKIANAIVRTAKKIFVIGVGQGSTNILVSDENRTQIASLDINVVKEISGELIKEVLKKALPNSDIQITSIGSTIVLSGVVDSPLESQTAMDIAQNISGQGDSSGGGGGGSSKQSKIVNALQIRGKDQVMLKVTIAEIQRSVLKQLGVNFDGSWSVANLSSFKFLTDNGFSLNSKAPVSGITSNFGGNAAVDIKTLERQGVARTLAEPTLTAISGESAKFLAGGEISVPTSESCNTETGTLRCTASLSYKSIGVALNFTPVVLSESRISIRLSTEVTELDADNATKLQQTVVPGFRTRKAETTVELPSGGVLATAGLIQQQSRQHINGIPGLMNIPILGSLFRSRDYQRYETELLILVQPFIAKPSEAGQIARPDDGFSDPSDPDTIFAGKLNKTYGSSAQQVISEKSFPVGFIHE